MRNEPTIDWSYLEMPSLISRTTSKDQKVLLKAQQLLLQKSSGRRSSHTGSPPPHKLFHATTTRKVKFSELTEDTTPPTSVNQNNTPLQSEMTPLSNKTDHPISWDDIFKCTPRSSRVKPKAILKASPERRISKTPFVRRFQRISGWTHGDSPRMFEASGESQEQIKLPLFKQKTMQDHQYVSNQPDVALNNAPSFHSLPRPTDSKINIVVQEAKRDPTGRASAMLSRNIDLQPMSHTLEQSKLNENGRQKSYSLGISKILKSASEEKSTFIYRKQRVPSSFKLQEVKRRDEMEDSQMIRRKQRSSTKMAQANAKDQLFRQFSEQFLATPKLPKRKKPDKEKEFKRRQDNAIRLRTPMQQAYIQSLLKQPKLPKIPIKKQEMFKENPLAHAGGS